MKTGCNLGQKERKFNSDQNVLHIYKEASAIRTQWSCGLIRHVLDREVEGSKLGLGLFFCSLDVSGKAIRRLLRLGLRPGKMI